MSKPKRFRAARIVITAEIDEAGEYFVKTRVGEITYIEAVGMLALAQRTVERLYLDKTEDAP